jgi:hypothetical protein
LVYFEKELRQELAAFEYSPLQSKFIRVQPEAKCKKGSFKSFPLIALHL